MILNGAPLSSIFKDLCRICRQDKALATSSQLSVASCQLSALAWVSEISMLWVAIRMVLQPLFYPRITRINTNLRGQLPLA